MLKLRLSRTGKNRQPSFRVLLQERTAAIKGKFIEELGYYKPANKPKEVKLNLERIKHWLSVGAQPSDTLAVLLKHEGLENMDQFIEPRRRQRKKKGEQAVAESAPAAAAVLAAPAAGVAPVAAKPAETAKPAEAPKPTEASVPTEPAPAAETPAEAPKS